MSEMVRLGDVATYVNGYAFKPSDWSDSGVPIIRIQDLTGNSYQSNYYDGSVDKKYEVKKGDILISWSASLGVYVWQGETAVLNQHIFKVVFDKMDVDSSFFKHQVEQILQNASSAAHGATMKHLTKPVFDSLPFYYPPLPEQRHIAAVLDKVSELIALRKKQLALLDEMVKARFVEMFGDPVRNEKGWEFSPLNTHCDIITGNTPSRAEKNNYGDYIEWIKSDNIKIDETYLTQAEESLSKTGFTKCRYVNKGSILMTCIAGSLNSIGNVALANRRVAFNQQINAIVPKIDEPFYIYWLMKLSKVNIHKSINMSLKGILSKSKLANLKFAFPPIELQSQFAQFVQQVEKSKATVQQGLDRLILLKSALMQDFLDREKEKTGEYSIIREWI